MGILNGDLIDADELMSAYGANFNDTAQVIFNADYIGYDSRLANAGNPNLKNVFYSTFQTQNASSNYGFVYDSTNDLYETPDLSGITEYVIIEADVDDSLTWTSNDCVLTGISAGKWILFCDTGTDAVQRAQIHKSLWYGTNGANQLMLDFANVTAVKTSHANDVSKRGYFYNQTIPGGGGDKDYIDDVTGTFADTSTNTNCSIWSYFASSESGSSSVFGDTLSLQMPSGSTLHSLVWANNSSNSSDELGTDTSGDEKNNPASFINTMNGNWNSNSSASANSHGIILATGGISFAYTKAAADTNGVLTTIDFTTDNSIPIMTAAGSFATEGADTATLIFKDTAGASVTNAISAINSEIDGTSSEQISISANGGSNYTDVNNTEIARPTAGTALWRRIVIIRTDLSKLDKVTEQAVKYNYY